MFACFERTYFKHLPLKQTSLVELIFAPCRLTSVPSRIPLHISSLNPAHPRYPHRSDSSRSRSGLRTEDLFSAPRSSVLEAPEEIYAPAPTASRRRSRQQPEPTSRRDFGDDFASTLPDTSGADETRRKPGYRLRLSGRALQVPKTLWGRIFSTLGFLLFLAVCGAVLAAVRGFFLHDPRFTVPSSSAIQTTGNTHLSRAQLLSVFGEDVERNIFNIPLAQRRTELQSLPWVEHATVMRLLPDHVRISVVERTPVAFTRQGNQIGLVDASGVLLDMPPDAPGDPSYSFPVVTGITSADPLSTRAARMRIYQAFTSDLDSTGQHISSKLSEVDLSNPEDIKALIPDGSTDILVHFGDTDYLARYQKFEDHLHEWLADHPKLASVDMRYEHQVILEMLPGAPTAPVTSAAPSQPKASALRAALKPVIQPAAAAAKKPATAPTAKAPIRPLTSIKAATVAKPATSEPWHMVVVKPHTKAAADLARSRLAHPNQAAPQ